MTVKRVKRSRRRLICRDNEKALSLPLEQAGAASVVFAYKRRRKGVFLGGLWGSTLIKGGVNRIDGGCSFVKNTHRNDYHRKCFPGVSL